MRVAVVPVRNEEKRLGKAIKTLLTLPLERIIPVINGSSDDSLQIVLQFRSPRISPIYYKEPLGIDVPRAIGAKAARDIGASAVLFMDGDMDGDIAGNVNQLILQVESGQTDMSLTNCYPEEHKVNLSSLASSVLDVRQRLNRTIGLEEAIGAASPSHGPHAVSRRFLLDVPLREMAVPPVSLGLAAKGGLKIRVGTTLPHRALGSPERSTAHSELIAQTIIGDCLEAIQVYRDARRVRSSGLVEYDGYHSQRRWDLLDDYLGNTKKIPAHIPGSGR